MPKKNNPKKRHHYIPVFYLNGFTNTGGCLWVYDKDDKGLFESSPEGIAYEKNYFTFITPEGEKDSESIENLIAEIEGESSKVLSKILKQETLTDDEHITFSCFIASMMVRAPNFRNNIQKSTAEIIKHLSVFIASSERGFASTMQRYEKDTGDTSDVPIEELRKWMVDPKNYNIEVDPQFAIGMALNQLERLTQVFSGMSWCFLAKKGDTSFVTGDNPLCYVDPTHDPRSFYGVGLANKNIEVTLPLSKDICALGTWQRAEGHKDASDIEIKKINRRTVLSSVRFIFGDKRSETLDRFVKKYKGSHRVMKVS